MADLYDSFQSGLESPATRLQELTPDDVSDLAIASRALVVAASGFVQVTTVEGDTGRVFIAAGVPFPVRAARVWATGTTATGIVSLC